MSRVLFHVFEVCRGSFGRYEVQIGNGKLTIKNALLNAKNQNYTQLEWVGSIFRIENTKTKESKTLYSKEIDEILQMEVEIRNIEDFDRIQKLKAWS